MEEGEAAAAGDGNGSEAGSPGGGVASGPGGAPYSSLAAAWLAALVALLIAFTVAGNVLVVLAVRSSRALRAPQNLFLVSLAGADILVAALVMPFSLANELMGAWAFGRAWCNVYLALDVLFCTASIVHLCAISLDRYWSVTRAVEYSRQRTAGRIKGAILGAWLLSAAISCPPLFSGGRRGREGGDSDDDEEGGGGCRLNDDTWYIVASCVASFFAPCLIMGLVYVRIYRVAKRRTRTLSEKRPPPDGSNGPSRVAQEDDDDDDEEEEESSPSAAAAEGGRRARAGGRASASLSRASGSSRRASSSGGRALDWWASQRSRRRRGRREGGAAGSGSSQAREKRFTFVLAVVMGVFVLCWFPFFFSYTLYGICREACRVPETLFKFFFWIGYCNSALNPLIYTVFNQDFRRSFKRILFGGSKNRRRRKQQRRRLQKMFFLP